MNFSVTVLGSNSAVPTLHRNASAQVINHNERIFLVDCADGTQLQLRKNRVRIQRINHILISHLHGDHFFGLIGLISTMHLLGRKNPLHVYGHEGLKTIIDLQLDLTNTTLKFELVFHDFKHFENSPVYEDKLLTIKTIPLTHSVPSCGFIFKEKQAPRKLKKEVIQSIDIPVNAFNKIKLGSDFTDKDGNHYKNSELTIKPPPPRSYAYCSDTAYDPSIPDHIQNVDLLYHEATFMEEMADIAAEKYHSTAKQAALIAKNSGAHELLIGHFSNRYEDLTPLENEAREIFPHTIAAKDGSTYQIHYKNQD
ncbi:MAG: ribonuclease Z [Bacteroidales bacterium]|nr:ribonuclease Z [Bacteroidales bacterium]